MTARIGPDPPGTACSERQCREGPMILWADVAWRATGVRVTGRLTSGGLPVFQGAQAGHLERSAPYPATLANQVGLKSTGGIAVVPVGRAVARRAARHRADPGVPARVQGAQAGHLERQAPRPALLTDHEPLLIA